MTIDKLRVGMVGIWNFGKYRRDRMRESGLFCYHVTAYCHELRIFGTKGNLYLDTHQRRAWFQPRKRNEVEERVEVPVPAADPGQACANLVEWHRAIREGATNYPNLDDGIRAVLPVFAAELAAKERREVALSEL